MTIDRAVRGDERDQIALFRRNAGFVRSSNASREFEESREAFWNCHGVGAESILPFRELLLRVEERRLTLDVDLACDDSICEAVGETAQTFVEAPAVQLDARELAVPRVFPRLCCNDIGMERVPTIA